jgi:hypothetical protein
MTQNSLEVVLCLIELRVIINPVDWPYGVAVQPDEIDLLLRYVQKRQETSSCLKSGGCHKRLNPYKYTSLTHSPPFCVLQRVRLVFYPMSHELYLWLDDSFHVDDFHDG